MAIYDGNTLVGNEKFRIGDIINFDYVGSVRSVALPGGVYHIECWGAQGADRTKNGGKGAYCSGNISLTNTLMNIYVGQAGLTNAAAFNGGGNFGGGGASDIRIVGGNWDNITSLRSRIMVAAGGGGSCTVTEPKNLPSRDNGGAGGAIDAKNIKDLVGGTPNASGATQTSGGIEMTTWGVSGMGSFGIGGLSGGGHNTVRSGGAGGGGYYGGGGGYGDAWNSNPGSGGSSFISGYPGCNAILDETSTVHTDQPNHYSGLIFYDTEMTSGEGSIPNPRGVGVSIGNSGNGYVRITVMLPQSYLVEYNDDIYYHDGNEYKTLEKEESELTMSDFQEYGILPNSTYLTKPELSFFGNSVRLLSLVEVTNLQVLPHDQIIYPKTSIDLSLADNIQQIIPNDSGTVYRLFSIDDGTTWETIINEQRQVVQLSGVEENDVELIRDYGMSSSDLLSVTPDIWDDVFPPGYKEKKVMFLMLITDSSKSHDISLQQQRFGYYESMIRGSDYDDAQYNDRLVIKFKKAIDEVKINFVI